MRPGERKAICATTAQPVPPISCGMPEICGSPERRNRAQTRVVIGFSRKVATSHNKHYVNLYRLGHLPGGGATLGPGGCNF